MFKAKAYLDLSERKEQGENIDSRGIRKHKNDVLRIIMEFVLENVRNFPIEVSKDMEKFISKLEIEPFDKGLLKNYGVDNEEIIDRLRELMA